MGLSVVRKLDAVQSVACSYLFQLPGPNVVKANTNCPILLTGVASDGKVVQVVQLDASDTCQDTLALGRPRKSHN